MFHKSTIDEIVEDVAADGYEFYSKLFKAICEENEDHDRMDADEIHDLAIALVPEVIRRYYAQDYAMKGVIFDGNDCKVQ